MINTSESYKIENKVDNPKKKMIPDRNMKF